MPVFLLAILLVATSAYAQVLSRPTDPPLVNASGESWYQLREPMLLGAGVYFHSGAAVFFNGNEMVRAGHYNGVPLYVDATMEPYSVFYVPIGRGLMQPYERKRQGAMAGMAGSRLSGYPLRLFSNPDPAPGPALTATAPTQLPFTAGAVVSFTPETISFIPAPLVRPGIAAPAVAAPPIVEAMAVVQAPPVFIAKVILTPTIADSNDGIWLRYDNARWVSSGRAEARTDAFSQVGSHEGFPVLRRAGETDRIYIPTRDGLVAPYRRKG